MIRYHLKELIADKEFAERRRITIGEIAKETGINRMTLSRILNHPGHSTVTDNLDALCNYFGCDIEQLITHIKDSPVGDQTGTGNDLSGEEDGETHSQ